MVLLYGCESLLEKKTGQSLERHCCRGTPATSGGKYNRCEGAMLYFDDPSFVTPLFELMFAVVSGRSCPTVRGCMTEACKGTFIFLFHLWSASVEASKNCTADCLSSRLAGYWGKFSISNNRTSVEPHWLRYCLCTKILEGAPTVTHLVLSVKILVVCANRINNYISRINTYKSLLINVRFVG